MASSDPPRKTIVIIGSGVIGLTVAHVLTSLPANPYNVTVVARDTLDDMHSQAWASPWAGANWSPIGDYDERKYKWESRTFGHSTKLAQELPTRAYFADPKELDKIWYKDICRDFRVMPSTAPLPLNMQAGITFTTVSLNPLVYLPWLHSELSARGVRFVRRALESVYEAALIGGPGCIVVNATGMGARSLIGVEDTKCYPIRGQTTVVSAPGVTECVEVVSGASAPSYLDPTTSTGHATYLIPRPSPAGTVLLGGTFQPHNWDTSLSVPTAQGILARCAELAPALRGPGVQVLYHGVGLRPAREGGARVEAEWVEVPPEEERGGGLVPKRAELGEVGRVRVVHAYGFGPAGYQSSWGAAEEVVELIQSS
ncbi:FAD dependent oxidoreductase [Gloeophyllum trabeum ATCC 11539]|uniref:FAD dependent oxidoreductase n=1 Tax=Gloeophyllum trabeum (strain ATCC 11539 / FP-39264 / Madison 617) TaxID=670483 RepID=S7S2X8_GLOTA|nr:FAD dependent oxidoreductase [Gloeophyllum trabeum ATCC 11539]EPQ60164.1 FAD dependent oxidoreductase [Gloeophyllum trabeum ATCC 11539]